MANPAQQVSELRGRFVGPDGEFTGRVRIDGEHIAAVDEEASSSASDELTWVPGFVDLHNHGGNLGAFPSGTLEECRRAADFHRAHGTTTLLASLVSGNHAELCGQAEILAQLAEAGEIAGIHMEGPFVNAGKCGAQDPSRIVDGDPELFASVIDAAGGHLRAMTFAPETAAVPELLDLCAQHKIIASLGHTTADYELTVSVIAQAHERGVTVTATHLFNAMPPVHHREPGAVAALLNAAKAGEAYVELIADGVHLADGTVDMAYSGRAFAITDAMEAAGVSDGEYKLGHLRVQVTDGVARVDSGSIAGGTSTLAEQFARFAQRHGLAEAVRFTSTTAAHVLCDAGLQQATELGEVGIGKRANLVGLDSQLQVRRVMNGGRELEA
ncbi:amidohydrolase family protein [Corynebacterium camporealensis]|uniref:N-acetylglucosamine-6-phosphate deacetylase n=1 Tax=Corynebacterium camporealensis TaxID=161896 RepID=UPI0034CD9666